MAYNIIKGFNFVFLLTSCHSSGFLLDTTPTYVCVDQQQNCDVFNSSFNVCNNLHNAYQICRKFCGLCSVVHGGWSVWSAWGVCDVTCGNGTMTRSRQCNNPTPLNGGEDCQGPSQNNGECILNRCPTHGGWSAWNEWGSCSVTCGVGLRRRDRVCDNPWPSSDGNHCFGDNINYEICSKPVCATWTDWGSWSSCSNTCGYGLKERYRNCSGTFEPWDFCVGSDVQNVMCKTSCNENRSWSTWGAWGSCSNTCGSGLRKRTRSCVGSTDLINLCIGTDEQDDICNITCAIRKPTSGFTADGYSGSGSDYYFPNIILNEGNDYVASNGLFTCRIPGLYYFSVNLEKRRESSRTIDQVNAYIRVNGATKAQAHADPHDDENTDTGSYMIGTAATLRLSQGDRVNIAVSSYAHFQAGTFTGVLIETDTT
ncbi:coadhesin-like isoform X1 [Dreissena polymorpha]|nr:coadhesin-like isoform X1 [Dreissena polymorpha]